MTTITATQLAKSLSDVLNRVRYRGEEFVVERNGEAVARLVPATCAGITASELVQRVGDLATPGDGFADALEAAQQLQGLPAFPEWPF